MGFDYRQSIKTAAWLHAIGKIEFYKIKPPSYDIEITAVRLKSFSKLFAVTFRNVSVQANEFAGLF